MRKSLGENTNGIKYLSFPVNNEIFAENSWYFSNPLVRANYNDLKNGIHETTEYLAEKMGVTRQTIIAIENNKYDPTLELAMKIYELFGVSVSEYRFHTEEQMQFLDNWIKNRLD